MVSAPETSPTKVMVPTVADSPSGRESLLPSSLPLTERCAAIAELADKIGTSQGIGLERLQRKARILFRADSDIVATDRCLVCGIPLCGNQSEFCWGHWDYLVVRIPDGCDGVLSGCSEVVDELRTLTGLEVRQKRPYYIGVTKGKCRCSVCNDLVGISERIVNANGDLVKWHYVCVDHVTFRHLEIDNSVHRAHFG